MVQSGHSTKDKDMKATNEGSPVDLLYGLAAIAEHLGLTVAQVKWQIAKCGWPVFKQGAKVCARRSTLAKYFAALEAAGRGGSRNG